MKSSKFVLAIAATVLAAGTANAADLYGSSKDEPQAYHPAASASGWWFDAGGGYNVTLGTDKGTFTTVTVSGPAETGTVGSTTTELNGVKTTVSVTKNSTNGYVTTTTVVSPVKAHISSSGALGEMRGGYAFNLGGGWFVGPAIGVGYTADSDSVTYSGALELGRRWGNAQLKIGAGYMGQHVKGEPFSGASFGTDAGGFMGLVQGDMFLNKNTSLFVRVEEVANGSFNASGNGYAYKVNTYDTMAVAGLGIHW